MRNDFRVQLLGKYPWLTFVLPFLVYMLVGAFEPAPPDLVGKTSWINIPYAWYPATYTIKIFCTVAAMAVVWQGYRAIPLVGTRQKVVCRTAFSLSTAYCLLPSVFVGAVGVVLWVGLCNLGVEKWILTQDSVMTVCRWMGLGDISMGARPSFDPFRQMGHSLLTYAFLAVRFFGLVIVVPVIEEFFLRGFAMRFVMAERWWEVPLGRMNAAAVAVSLALPALTHPGELLAALAWFGMITIFYWRTRSLWNCVVAHAATNLLLGVYIVTTGSWWLW
jgi:CAAX prenyl protease-like protein